MSSSRRIVIHLMSPIHALAAMAAVAVRESDSCEIVCLIYQPGLTSDSQAEVAKVIGTMLASFPCRLISVATTEWENMRSGAPETIIRQTGLANADAIYYAHDVVGDVLDVLSQTYTKAERICFGDAMGQVFERHVHLAYILDGQPPRPQSRFRSLRAKFRNEKWRIQRRYPDEAILILPVDQSGEYLKAVPYRVCPLVVVRAVLEKMVKTCSDLAAYQEACIRAEGANEVVILLTENFAEGEFLSLEAEVELYAEVVQASMPEGTTVILKPHPAETLPRAKALQAALPGYTVRVVERALCRYPIELWKKLLIAHTVIAMQYPALSLKYLYDIDVIQPMDNRLIERWFPQHLWASYKNSLALNMLARSRLGEWDGRSPLYSGHNDGVDQ